MNQKLSVSEHERLVSLMEALSLIALKIERTKKTFPNYCQHLEERYQLIVADARSKNLLPPWMPLH